MPISPIDALMQVGAPKRAAESAPRHDSGAAFQPALEQAYQAEAPAKPTAPKPPERKPEEKAATTGEQRDSKEPAEEAAAASNSPETDAVINDDAEAGVVVEGEDAAEISEEAAAAMLAAQEAVIVEPIMVAVEGEQVEEVAAVAEPQAPAVDGAGETGTGENGEGEEAESAEIKFATLSSTQTESTDQQAANAGAAEEGQATAQAESLPKEKLAPTVETTTPAPGVGQTGGEKLTATTQADESTDEKSDGAESEEQAESKDSDALPEVKVEAVAEETAASAASSASNVELTSDEAANTALPAPEAAAVSADPASKTTGALDRLMEGRSLRNSKEPSDPNGMPPVDRARFVQRVEGAMKAAQQRDGKIQVRLSPPELGSVKIELALQNGVMSAKLEAETPAARNLLLDSLPALRERLAQQDIRIEKFDVDVRQEGGNAGSGQTDDRTADQSGERQQHRPRSTSNHTPATPVVARAIAASGSAAAGLDVRV